MIMMEVTEQERLVILLLRLAQKRKAASAPTPAKHNGNQVRISVSEDLTLGEKIGGQDVLRR